jgi:DNA-binding response OmpR family regulator
VYFTPYSHEDLKALLKIHSPEVVHNENILEALTLSGGHIQLLQLILRSSTPNNLQHDPYIKLLLKDILSFLTHPQVRIIERIAQEKTVDIDNFLLQIGVVKRDKETYQLFSPLLKEYICKKKSFHLSVKEQLLFQFLKKNSGKIMSKEKIIETVWKNITTGSTDWALDSLIYRLRNHPYIKEKGYEIINHKKLGYQLVKE